MCIIIIVSAVGRPLLYTGLQFLRLNVARIDRELGHKPSHQSILLVDNLRCACRPAVTISKLFGRNGLLSSVLYGAFRRIPSLLFCISSKLFVLSLVDKVHMSCIITRKLFNTRLLIPFRQSYASSRALLTIVSLL